MKKIALAALLAASFGVAHANLITFDDVSGSVLPAGYGGVNWNNFYELDTTYSGYTGTGYRNGTVSGTHVAYNSGGAQASLSATSAHGFDLTDAYFAGAWDNNLHIVANATFENGTHAAKSFFVNTTGASEEFFNWTDLASVTFVSSGGTPQRGLSGAGTQFALDNVNTTAAVREPANVALMLAGVGLLGMMARRRRRTA